MKSGTSESAGEIRGFKMTIWKIAKEKEAPSGSQPP